jgi:predicted MPP superfamily phosphohydrolase
MRFQYVLPGLGVVLALGLIGQSLAAAPAKQAAASPSDASATLPGQAPLPAVFPTIDVAKGDFTMVVMPDIQRYSKIYQPILRSQIHWAVTNREKMNIRFVTQLGDLTDDNTDEEWTTVDQAFSELDEAGLPYLVVPGNHDYDHEPWARGQKANSDYNAVFSYYRFLRKPWYGGHYGMTNTNSFAYFDGGGVQFTVLGLEFGPGDDVLKWAKNVVKVHHYKPTQQVILVTHAYMNSDDTRLGPGDEGMSPHKHNPTFNDGDQIWDKLVRGFDNIPVVLSGHVTTGDGAGTLISNSDKGTRVTQMMSDYQTMEQGGHGYMRLLVFRPSAQRLDVYTYSPWLDAMLEGPRQNFSVPMPIFGKKK